MTLAEFKAAHTIYAPVTSHPEKFWAAVPKGSINPQVDMITAGTEDTIHWLLEVNYNTWMKKTKTKMVVERAGA